MDYKLLRGLVEALEAQEQAEQRAESLHDFAKWLVEYTRPTEVQREPERQPSAMPPQGDGPAQTSQLLTLMYKYLRFYLRKIFEHTPLSVPDDFGFMATLFVEGSLQKHQLIEKNTIEFSSGVEIIKRLEQRGLLETQPDEQDKRARRVGLTGMGRACFVQLLPRMAEVGRLAIAPLSEAEQAELLRLLHKLNDFHAPLFQFHRDATLAELLEGPRE